MHWSVNSQKFLSLPMICLQNEWLNHGGRQRIPKLQLAFITRILLCWWKASHRVRGRWRAKQRLIRMSHSFTVLRIPFAGWHCLLYYAGLVLFFMAARPGISYQVEEMHNGSSSGNTERHRAIVELPMDRAVFFFWFIRPIREHWPLSHTNGPIY